MKTNSGRLFILTVLIMFGAAFFLTGCDIIDKGAVTENITDNGGTFPAAKMAEFSGSVSDAAAAVPALKTSLNYAVSRAVELDANKNYIDVIDCATGLSVGTGSFGPLGTFTANTDILKHAGKNVMIDIGNKNADGENGLSLYKCFLGKMPNLNELPDAALFDSVKITNVIVNYETTAKAFFAAEKELYNNPANAIFSFTDSEVQADKNVSKQFSIDSIFDKKVEAVSGGAANIEAIANAVKTIAVVASSNLSEAVKNNLLQHNISNISDTLNAYARIVAGRVTNSEISNIITQNSIPTEIKLETEGATLIIDGSTTMKPVTPESIKNIEPVKMVEAPFFNIKDGEYSEAQTVTISSQTEGAAIVYTLDGSEPGENSGIKYDSPIAINKTTLIKAAAYKNGMVASSTANLKITITIAIKVVDAPVFDLKDGQYTGTQSVVLATKTPGASIYYTLNGTNPSKISGSIYSEAIEITADVTIKAIAIKDGMVDSEI
jgi:hypothetical protein